MKFSYSSYAELLSLLKNGGYRVCSYHDYAEHDRCVILRHDIDQSIEKSLELAKLEAEHGVCSTYFVMLTSDFYNVASRKNLDALRQIQALGHEIGLHFDEMAYEACEVEETAAHILAERAILEALLGTEVKTASMHRPSAGMLEADLQIPGMVNSYGKTFFRDFKYLSDSRCRWREPVLGIIRGGEYDRLHILTHAFWYHETEQTISETVGAFVRGANRERYGQMAENIRDLPEILKEDGI